MYGIIFQDFGKYAVSVRENIAFGEISKGFDENDIQKAAHASDADDFIAHLPDGYDTPLMRIFEENGIELSIGQWQKLSIARAFYSDSDVLILDEPTAGLDPKERVRFRNLIGQLGKDSIVLLSTHIVSDIEHIADEVLMMKDGNLIYHGAWDEQMGDLESFYLAQFEEGSHE
jgi:ABC-type multidrug transport system fused ATPase/permease subunit